MEEEISKKMKELNSDPALFESRSKRNKKAYDMANMQDRQMIDTWTNSMLMRQKVGDFSRFAQYQFLVDLLLEKQLKKEK